MLSNVFASSSLSRPDRCCTGVPTSSAWLSVGRARCSSRVAGAKSRPNAARSTRNGRWTLNDATAVSIVDGDLEMKSLSACGSRPIASNVSAIDVNSAACCLETGATMRAASASDCTKPWRSVLGFPSVAMTGCRWPNSGGSDSIVRPSASPRPANASPKPRRFSCDALRVGSSNMPKIRSMSVA